MDGDIPKDVRVCFRDLYGHERQIPGEVMRLAHEGLAIPVPGLGYLVLAKSPTLGWGALLANDPKRQPLHREVKHVEGDDPRMEIELLPNPSGEDRIVVVVRGAS